ncbi:hypothetical protein TNCV_2898401 [Trichonephila clavipes]|nr:hypothetical protein TNCV_2898401 [Trichonephila clavipes]
MTIENKVLLYTAVLRPILSYGSPVWGHAAKSNLKMAANPEPVHSSSSSNHKADFQPFQDGLFHHFDFVSKCVLAMHSLHVPTTNQVVPSPPKTATPSSTINNYDMVWRLALRAICPAIATEPEMVLVM